MDFFPGGSFIMDYGLVFWARCNGLKLKQLDDFVYC